MNKDLSPSQDIIKYYHELLSQSTRPLERIDDSLTAKSIVITRGLLDELVKRRQVERELLAFTSAAAQRRWQLDDFKFSLRGEFYRLVQQYFGVYDRPTDCSECNEHCSADFCCIELSQELSIYGCLRHASIHECASLQQKIDGKLVVVPPQCPCRRATVETDYVCTFSGRIVSKHLMDFSGSSKDFSSDDTHIRAQAGYQFRLSMMESEELYHRFENSDLVRAEARRSAENLERNKTPAANTVEFVESGPQLAGPPNADKKRRGEELASSKRIRLSGNNYFEYKKKIIVEEVERYVQSIADGIITDILFDAEARKLLNEEQLSRLAGEMRRSLSDYHSAQKRAQLMPVYTACIAAFYTPATKLKLLRIVEYDRAQTAAFCERAVSLWKLCHRSPAVINSKVEPCLFKKFALALLYCMRTGLTIPARGPAWTNIDSDDKIVVVACDKSLCVDLPDETLLKSFGKHGREALLKTLNKGGTLSDTTTDPTKLQRQRSVRAGRVPERIEIDGFGSVPCRSFLPVYLRDEAMGDTSCYSSTDLSTGMAFLKACVASFDESARPMLAFV